MGSFYELLKRRRAVRSYTGERVPRETLERMEHGEWLTARGRPDDAQALLAEARETFERLEAQPWLDRVDASTSGATAEVPA